MANGCSESGAGIWLIGPAFTPRRMESLRPAIEAVVTDLLDGLEALDDRADGAAVDLRAHCRAGGRGERPGPAAVVHRQ
ncbi:hypothetical protein ACIQ9E_00660 [Streptomyces sp. NPDC094448]|uniref:hypothetical protein n=1 Tax=Streptomyces sp. NPDC094448 TaxID=3366063 RepID=UPI00381FE3B6